MSTNLNSPFTSKSYKAASSSGDSISVSSCSCRAAFFLFNSTITEFRNFTCACAHNTPLPLSIHCHYQSTAIINPLPLSIHCHYQVQSAGTVVRSLDLWQRGHEINSHPISQILQTHLHLSLNSTTSCQRGSKQAHHAMHWLCHRGPVWPRVRDPHHLVGPSGLGYTSPHYCCHYHYYYHYYVSCDLRDNVTKFSLRASHTAPRTRYKCVQKYIQQTR